MYHYISIFLLTMALFNPLAWGQDDEARVVVVEVVEVVPSDLVRTARLLGTITARRSMLLTAKSNGIVDYAQPEGALLSKGNLIAQLENLDLDNNYQIAVEAELVAKNQYERAMTLAEQNVTTTVFLEDAQKRWLSARTDLSDARIKLDASRFIAPFDGVVGTYRIHEGAQVNVGDSIVYFYDPSDLIVTFDIPAPLLTQIHSDQEVIIDGKVLSLPYIQRMVDPATHMSPTYVAYDCSTCIVGMHVDVDLTLQKHLQVITLPTDAVFLKDSQSHVYIVDGDVVVLTPVTTGIIEKDRIEITEGIVLGDLVVATGHHRLYDGDKVRIHD